MFNDIFNCKNYLIMQPKTSSNNNLYIELTQFYCFQKLISNFNYNFINDVNYD